MVEVRLVAEDSFLTGETTKGGEPIPHVSPSSETYTFVVVPENELLSEIAREEEAKYKDLAKLVKPLDDNFKRLSEIHSRLEDPAGLTDDELKGMIARCDSLDDTLKGAHVEAKGVYATYERIIREMRLNQVREDVMHKVFRDVFVPLRVVSTVQFDRTQSAVAELRRAMNDRSKDLKGRLAAGRPLASKAKTELNELVTRIREVLNKMQGITVINDLIKEIRRMEEDEAKLGSLLYKIRKKRIKELLEKDK